MWWLNRSEPGIHLGAALLAIAILLALAAAVKQPALALIALLCLAAILGIRVFWDHAFSQLSYERRVSMKRAHIGDEVDIELIAINKKPIPISRLDVSELASGRTVIQDHPLRARIATHEQTFDTIFSLGAYERAVQRYTLDCQNRGWQRLGPARVIAADPLGLVTRDGAINGSSGVLVMPRTVPMLTPVIPARLPLGEAKPTAPLAEDPSRVNGIRPYVAGDSLRQINWRATARTGELQTRIHEQSADPVTMIFLDTANTADWDAPVDEVLELRVVVAASLARALLRDRQQVGLIANAPLLNRRKRTVVPATRKPGQQLRILDALAEITEMSGEPIERLLTEQNPKLPYGSTICLITSNFSAGAQRVLQRIARTGSQRNCVIICVGEAPVLSLTSRRLFDVYHLGQEVGWRDIPAITLARLA
ncbi:MAG: DUF58 domain-containing protein [Propionibacteriaceae bacterium]